MINRDSLFSIQWLDSFIYNMNIQKNENSLENKNSAKMNNLC